MSVEQLIVIISLLLLVRLPFLVVRLMLNTLLLPVVAVAVVLPITEQMVAVAVLAVTVVP
jgi:hypothetical protein